MFAAFFKLAPRKRAVAAAAWVCLGVGCALPALPALAAEAAAAVPAASDIASRQLGMRCPAGKIAFHGSLNFDSAGSAPGAMMYPAPGLGGLLVAIATHAALSNGMRDAEKQKLRDQADKILLPYQPLLGEYEHEELLQAALPLMRAGAGRRALEAAGATTPDEALVDSVPVFYMTQDKRALILENTVSIQSGGQAKPYTTVIRVVSPALEPETDAAFWFDGQAVRLKQESARIFAHSLDIAVHDMQSGSIPAGVFKTVRYDEGGVERMERAQLISKQCGQLVLRTLRGNIMSVPRRADDGDAPDAGCEAVAKG